MPDSAPLRPDEVYNALRDFFGDKASATSLNSATGEVEAHLYGVLAYRCGYSQWHEGVWELLSTVAYGGVWSRAIGSIEQGISVHDTVTITDLHQEFARIDEHCRLLLPSKYVKRFDRQFGTRAARRPH
ncbi:hypothetical protein [Humidisolicoccus flavus]|uniref:hypothetical protein n=1 Tax=Humidisolicoccus flavus TaxID=3111414 RepID=UPI00324F1755